MRKLKHIENQQELGFSSTNQKVDAIDQKEVTKEKRRNSRYRRAKCSCGRRMEIHMPRTTHDGRMCPKCGKKALTCHFCNEIICEWKAGRPNTELEYMPTSCPNCNAILQMIDSRPNDGLNPIIIPLKPLV
jgi:hypothetical protein